MEKNKITRRDMGESLETIQLYSKTHWDLPFPMTFKCDISLGCQRFGEKEIQEEHDNMEIQKPLSSFKC